MTTNQQRRLYFHAWQAAAKNHGWHQSRARQQAVPFFGTPELNALYQRICTIAQERASQPSTLNPQPSPDDFRHACHLVAFGKDLSSTQLTNAQLDRILALFNLLADPDDLTAWLAWSNPAESSRKRLLHWLRHNCQESYIVAISRERFATDNWEALDYPDLRQLHMTLKNRPNAQKTRKNRNAVPAHSPGLRGTSYPGSTKQIVPNPNGVVDFINVSGNHEPEPEPAEDNIPL